MGRPPERDWQAYLHSLEVFGMRPGLERVQALLERLGRPERSFRAIHVVGTNGKSSTTRYAAAVLQACGLRAAAYLSPHIAGFNERLLVEGRPVGADLFGGAVERVRAVSGELPAGLGPVTQFETLTVAAFLAAAEAGVEAAAIEAGLGGRLDATNVLDAPVVVLTNIGLEHTEVLGDTREQIFAEKAAVITRGADALFGPLDGLEPAAEQVCARAGARAHLLGRDVRVEGAAGDFTVTITAALEAGSAPASARHEDSLPGSASERLSGLAVPTQAPYQVVNAALAVAACRLLLGPLDEAAVRGALARAAVPGRLQVAGHDPLLIADGAHNPDGMRALAGALEAVGRPRPRVGVVAIMADKAVGEMLDVLSPLLDVLVCTTASEARSLPAGELAAKARRAGGGRLSVEVEPDPHEAVAAARRLAGPEGSVLVSGSLYLLADLADLLEA
ncbi:MAG TPA: cyanophycin synthetase [Thermoleophilia bacterium]|nr:cyanophycin synthetase [Thermoleophilia bacterium]